MYLKDFLKLTSLPRYLLFFGNEFFLNEYQQKIEDKFRDDNVLKLYFDEWDYELAKSHLIENSLFGGVNVLIVKHNKVPKNIEKLIEFTKNSYLFFFYYGNKTIPAFKDNFVRFFEPNINDVFVKLAELEKKFAITISQQAKEYLANSVEPLILLKELEKLSNYKKEINIFDVEELVFKYKEESFEDIFIKILKKEDFFEDLSNFLEKNDFKRFIPSFAKYLKDIYTYHLFLKKTNANSLKPLLGYQLPKHIEKERINIALNYDEKTLFKILDFLLLKELEVRKSYKDKEAIFYEVLTFLRSL